MWHKLFRSKSTKLGNAGTNSVALAAQDDHDDTVQLPQVLRLNHNADNDDEQLTTNIATVRKHKNKLSNPFKRSGGSNRNGGDSNSKRQCGGNFNTSNIVNGASGSKVVNVYESMSHSHSAQFSQTSSPYTLLSPTTTSIAAKDSFSKNTNLGTNNSTCNSLNPIEKDTTPVNDRQLRALTTFNGFNKSCRNDSDFNGSNRFILEDNRRIRPAESSNQPSPVVFEKLLEKLDVVPSTDIKLNLEKCPICARTFVPESLAKHVNICEKMNTKKRKVFDSSRQRLEGTELAGYASKPSHSTNTLTTQKSHDHILQPINKISPPKTTPLSRKFDNKTPLVERKDSTKEMSASFSGSATSKISSSSRRVMAQPQNDQCPYCERFFGIKAYDRHVEWCKEKALLKTINNKETVSAAKERLQARIKYKAPNLKTKRQKTREKYSGSLSCSGSTNSLNDLVMPLFKQKDLAMSDKKNFSVTNSMASSMTSESDYDPFLSAKRQLEELFSPSTTPKQVVTNVKNVADNTVTTNGSNPNNSNNLKNNLMTQSLKVTPVQPQLQPKKLTATTPTVTKKLSTPNFRRTSSLRLSKKVSKPLFSTNSNTRSNIVRGISPDDGPVSPNFVRANEYDELPVKSVYTVLNANRRSVTPSRKLSTPSLDERPIISRAGSATPSIDDKTLFGRRDSSTPSRDDRPIFSRTNSNSTNSSFQRDSITPDRRRGESEELSNYSTDHPILLRGDSARKNLKLDINSPNVPDPDNSISKTDSLAIFLRYEQDLKSSSSCLSEKDLKDKSNSLSKRSSTAGNESKENILENASLPDIIQRHVPSSTTNSYCNSSNNYSSPQSPVLTPNNINNSKASPKLESIDKKSHLTNVSSHGGNFETYIDTKLVNVCDNLSMTNNRLADSDGNSPNGSSSDSSGQSQSRRDDTPEKIIASNRSSGERRNILRRQIKLNKDSILYDVSPDTDPYSEECDQKISQLEAECDHSRTFRRHISTGTDIESIFDDFDFEEFISSFEDDENYPIFKDYKNILLSRTINDSKKTFGRSDSEPEETRSNSFTKYQSGITSLGNNMTELASNNRQGINIKEQFGLDNLSPTEKELLKSVSELNEMCTQENYPADSDDLSSIEGFPSRKNAGSKTSADSAYGSSQSRQSHPDRQINRRAPTKARHDLRMPDIQASLKQRAPIRQRDNLSMSSSGSESSLPPINANLKTQKMELHSHKEKSQSIEGKYSKFCYECGSRFIVSTAKFCTDCGVKRVAI